MTSRTEPVLRPEDAVNERYGVAAHEREEAESKTCSSISIASKPGCNRIRSAVLPSFQRSKQSRIACVASCR